MQQTVTSKIVLGYNQKRLKTAKLIDSLLNKFCKESKKNHALDFYPKKILVIQSHLIGDVIMATPMLKALKKAYPDSHISLLANKFATDLLEGAPFVDTIITMVFPWAMYDYNVKNLIDMFSLITELRREKYDLAIDAQIDMRNIFLMYLVGAKRRLGYDITGGKAFLTDVPEFPEGLYNLLEGRLSLLNHLYIDTSDKKTELPVEDKSRQWVESFLIQNNLHPQRLVGIHPGASLREKLWQPQRFTEIIDYLRSTGYQPVVIEGPQDKEIVDSIMHGCKTPATRLKTNLKNLVAFISRCRLIVCLDSAAIHIAGAVNVPVIAIYGPKWPELTKPVNDNIEILWSDDFDCRPCEYGHCEHIGHSCMDAISVDAVINKINEMLGNEV